MKLYKRNLQSAKTSRIDYINFIALRSNNKIVNLFQPDFFLNQKLTLLILFLQNRYFFVSIITHVFTFFFTKCWVL